MGIDIEYKNDVYFVKVNEEDLENGVAQTLGDEVLKILKTGENKSIQVDLSSVESIDSSGVGKLIFLDKKTSEYGGTFRLEPVSAKLYDFFEKLTLTKIFNIKAP